MARINEKTLIKIAIAIGVVYLMYLVFVPRTCSMCSGRGRSSRGSSSRGSSSRWSGRGHGVYGLIDGTNGELYGRLDYEDDATADDATADDATADDATADDATADMFVEIPNEDDEDDEEYSDDDFEGDSDLEGDSDFENDDFEDETFALYENDLGRDTTVYM